MKGVYINHSIYIYIIFAFSLLMQTMCPFQMPCDTCSKSSWQSGGMNLRRFGDEPLMSSRVPMRSAKQIDQALLWSLFFLRPILSKIACTYGTGDAIRFGCKKSL